MILDPRLEADSSSVIDLTLCQIRLHHNAAFPWVILIPRNPSVVELIDLSLYDQQLLMQEISFTCRILQELFHPTKLNIATLGNIVPQLHVHIIARTTTDPAWPQPVWNSGVVSSYTESEKKKRISDLQEKFSQISLLPSSPLQQAYAYLEDAAKEGFDWESSFEAASKIQEELEEIVTELKKPLSSTRQNALKEELGDLYLACNCLARYCDVIPEEAISVALEKFRTRYERLKKLAASQNISLLNASRSDLLALWRLAKETTL